MATIECQGLFNSINNICVSTEYVLVAASHGLAVLDTQLLFLASEPDYIGSLSSYNSFDKLVAERAWKDDYNGRYACVCFCMDGARSCQAS